MKGSMKSSWIIGEQALRAPPAGRASHWVAGRVAAEAAGALVDKTLGALRWLAGAVAVLAVLAALLSLAACGPGLGGTGTGATQDALSAYGAREVPVCQSEFADAIGCTPASAGAAPLPATESRFFAETTPTSRALLTLDGQEALLQLRCLNLVFAGAFGQIGADTPRYFGVVTEGGRRITLATLQVQRSATGLTLTLVDSTGQTLFGAQALSPVAGITAPAGCS